MISILQVGSLPPPSGGVSIHVQRLISALEADREFRVNHIDPRELWHPKNARKILMANIVHIHISNSAARLILLVALWLFQRTTVFTFHGNVGRYGNFRNTIDRYSIMIASKVVVLNKESALLVHSLRNDACLISSFIPPSIYEPLPSEVAKRLANLKLRTERLYCTNAFSYAIDHEGNEIYGILRLIDVFRELPNFGLFISDNTGSYTNHLRNAGIDPPDNVVVCHHEHDFCSILIKSDCYIRATSTDGDSLSVREAQFLGIPVIASDIVDRPHGVHLFNLHSDASLRSAIMSTNFYTPDRSIDTRTVERLSQMYRELR